MKAMKARSLLRRIAGVALVILVWELVTRIELLDPRFFPPFTEAVGAAVRLWFEGVLPEVLGISLRRLVVVLVLAVVGGVLSGLLAGTSRLFDWATRPLVDALFPVPKIAFLPLLLLVVGRGEVAFLTIAFATALFAVFTNVRSTVQHLDPGLLEAGRAFGATGVGHLLRVVLPAAMPGVLNAIGVAAGLCIIALSAVEFVAARSGLGYLVYISWQTFRIDEMYAAILVIGTLGVVTASLVAALGRVAMPHYRSDVGAVRFRA